MTAGNACLLNDGAAALVVVSDDLDAHGGVIAVGHPFGMTGARTTTLLTGLRATGGTVGL